MKFKESEITVFYLWSQKDNHGTPKPLPFKICKIWHASLGTHLKNIHKFSSDEITREMNAFLKMYETNICNMNALRSSNIFELRVSDIHDAEIANKYPGYMTFANSKYKTSIIYG